MTIATMMLKIMKIADEEDDHSEGSDFVEYAVW